MDNKSINIEVLLKAAEYIEQTTNKEDNSPNLSEFFGQLNQNNNNWKRQQQQHSNTDLLLPFSKASDELTRNVKIFNDSINNLKQQHLDQALSIKQTNDNIKLKYAKNVEHNNKREDYDDDQKLSGTKDNRNKITHNILEKNRRAHLKECFENLQNELPLYKDKKVTNLLILKQTCKYLEQSKKKEKESALEIKRLLAQNIALVEHLTKLRDNFSSSYLVDFDLWINQNTNRLKEMKMLNYLANYIDNNNTNSVKNKADYDEETSKKFDSFESESSEFDSEYNENSKSN